MIIGLEKKKSNYSIFLMSLLLVEFISYFLRASSLPNLGIIVRACIFSYIIGNFLLLLFVQIVNGYRSTKIVACAIYFWMYSAVIYLINNSFDPFDVVNITSWVAVLYLFNYYGFPSSVKALKTLMIAFVLIFIALYYVYALNREGVSNKPGVKNAIYYLVFCMPFIIILKNRLIRNTILIIISLLVMASQKGTAIVIVFATLFIYFLLVKKRKKVNMFVYLGGCIAFVLVCILVITISGIDVVSLFNEDVDSNGNGRFVIWSIIIERFINGDIFHKVFGYGLDFAVKNIGASAHCDYIEILGSFGIIGLILFIRWFWAVMIKIIASVRNSGYLSSICLVLMAQIVLIMLSSTTIFVSNYFLLLMALLGMILNSISQKEKALMDNKTIGEIK